MSHQRLDETADETAAALVETLRSHGAGEEDPAAVTAEILTETERSIEDADPLQIDHGLVTQSLEELLLMFVGLRTNDASGKGIMEDLDRFLGVQPSPGTVYPTLHDLDERGLLDVHELVQTKEYLIDDEGAAAQALREAARQHRAMGQLFQRALEDIGDQ
ncbi:PadR family transcriptional regulator [Halobacteriales archaeon QH_7_69_31]|nr:MAG: PadR family transcriptional regulator [Halobacteriales archaeon QH_7_69_31]